MMDARVKPAHDEEVEMRNDAFVTAPRISAMF
jgi:hypothetical protein